MDPNNTTSVLKDTLKKFLTHGEKPHYHELTVSLVSTNPMRITDNENTYLETTSFLTEEDLATIQKHYNKGHDIVLKDWTFIFTRIPNTHDYFTDMLVREYELVTLKTKPKHTAIADYHSMVEDKELK